MFIVNNLNFLLTLIYLPSTVDSLDEISQPGEIELYVRELSTGTKKYKIRKVKAIVSSSSDNLPGGDTLWIRYWNGRLHPHPWAIKIVEELPDYTEGYPYGEAFAPKQ